MNVAREWIIVERDGWLTYGDGWQVREMGGKLGRWMAKLGRWVAKFQGDVWLSWKRACLLRQLSGFKSRHL